MRPTGRLHIGHYFGALSNWIRMQEEYDCFFFVADWHALTTDYADTSQIARNGLEIAADWLAAGLDPAKCRMFVQSSVPEHAELHLLLSMVTPLSWLERVPTYKEQLENIKDKDLHTYGFLGYPLLQSADIVMYGEPKRDLVVPVGEDQVPHVELTREIVRRFNLFYSLELDEDLRRKGREGACGDICNALAIPGPSPDVRDFPLNPEKWHEFESRVRQGVRKIGFNNALQVLRSIDAAQYVSLRPTLQEPQVMLTPTSRILGTDGRKMSKSYGNVIELGESDESIREKTRVMMTDPARKRREDPGNPDVCPVFSWHKLFSTPETIAWSDQGCRTAGIGCIECKAAMAEGLIRWIAPIRARRQEYQSRPERVREILRDGSAQARRVAWRTMRRVRDAVFGPDRLKRPTRVKRPARKRLGVGR